MKFRFYLLGVLVYVVIATAIRQAGIILGGIPTALLFFVTVYLIPRIITKRQANPAPRKKNDHGIADELHVPEDIAAHCGLTGNNDQLITYLKTCVDKGLLTQEQSSALFEEYKFD